MFYVDFCEVFLEKEAVSGLVSVTLDLYGIPPPGHCSGSGPNGSMDLVNWHCKHTTQRSRSSAGDFARIL